MRAVLLAVRLIINQKREPVLKKLLNLSESYCCIFIYFLKFSFINKILKLCFSQHFIAPADSKLKLRKGSLLLS
jgi:hypothetical protein